MDQRQRSLSILSCFGVVLGAWYMLTLLRGVFFGEVKEPHHGHGAPTRDLNFREWAALAPIAALCLLLGVYPQPFIDTADPEIRAVSRTLDDARRAPPHVGAPASASADAPALASQAPATPAPGE